MEKVRIGMVGSKFAADFHADSYARNPQAEIVAVAAIDNLEEYSKKWGVKDTMTDFKELCKRDDVDLVDVCVPNFLHHDVVMEAAANRKHIICEKPLATTVEDAREMVDFVKKQGVKLMYGEDWIFAPALRRAIELIGEQPRRRRLLAGLGDKLRRGLSVMGFDTGASIGPIVPMIIGKTDRAVRLSRELAAHGFYVPAIRPPSVRPGTSRLRLSVTAEHVDEDIEKFLQVVETIR